MSQVKKQNPQYYKDFPDVDRVIHNKAHTIVILNNGEKGITRCRQGTKRDPEKGFWIAYAKALRTTAKKYCLRKPPRTATQMINIIQKFVGPLDYNQKHIMKLLNEGTTQLVLNTEKLPHQNSIANAMHKAQKKLTEQTIARWRKL